MQTRDVTETLMTLDPIDVGSLINVNMTVAIDNASPPLGPDWACYALPTLAGHKTL